jgi:hypothetical protein
MFGESAPKRDVHAPLDPGDHPGFDTSSLLGAHDTSLYMYSIGAVQWVATLGRLDLFSDMMTMSGFRDEPCERHLVQFNCMFANLRNNMKMSIKCRTDMPDYSQSKPDTRDWSYVAFPVVEEEPADAPLSIGKCARRMTFADVNLMHDMVT